MRYIPIEKTKQQLEVIKRCISTHGNDSFLLATDAEREGELIGDEILRYAGFSNFQNAKRFWVSEALTKDVILSGIQNAKPLAAYSAYKQQGYARQHADWLIGMNISRFLSLKCGTLLTVGRVQSAVLAAVYEREKLIAGFTKEKYVEVAAAIKADTTFQVKLVNAENKDFPTRFPEYSPLVKQVLASCVPPLSGTVESFSSEKKTVPPPQLLNITALQKEAHKAFNYTPEQTLNIAQSLYENHKCLSYPRTPSRVMGDGNVVLVKGIYDSLKKTYPKEADGTVERAISSENKRVFNTKELQDHHALIPLAALPPSASREEANVYSLVLESFFTVLKPAYVYNAVSVTMNIGGFLFTGTGVEVLQLGWMQGNQDKETLTQSPSGLRERGVYPVTSINREEKYTEPKKRYTYATLLQLMENPRGEDGHHLAGLGTPAPRGSILKTLFDREYTALQGKSILITDKGKFLIETLYRHESLRRFVSLPETTRWEERLHEDTAAFLEGIKAFIRETVQLPLKGEFKRDQPSLGKCPLCGSPVLEGKKSFYCAGYKAGCGFTVWKETAHASVSAADVTAMLSGKKTRLKKCAGKDRKPFEARFYLKEGKVAFEFEKAPGRG
jgi:DNA topoisomerase-3